jgi:hypothetical protein
LPIPDTRDGLVSVGYTYTGSSICRTCGKDIEWFLTPRGNKMGVSPIPGTEDEDPQRLEFHKCEGK